jgi:nucleoside-diphosphate-sugar epimerase
MDNLAVQNNQTVCILGATGFIGKHLLRIVSESGAVLKVLTRDSTKLNPTDTNVKVVEGDLLQRESINDFFEPGAIVVNLAYLNTQSKTENIEVAHNLVACCIKARVARMVHCSTAVVVGRVSDNIVTENTICYPMTEYEKVKLEIENILLEGLKDISEVVIVRPTAVFGENGKNLRKLTNELINASRMKVFLKTALYSRRKMNLVCVENVAHALLFLAFYKGDPSGIYIVSEDDIESNNYYDVANLLCHQLGLGRIRLFYFPFHYFFLSLFLWLRRLSNINPNRIYSSEKLQELGFKKVINFQDGINRFSEWYKNAT